MDKSIDLAGEAASLAALHSCRSQAELGDVLIAELARRCPGVSLALCLAGASNSSYRVEAVIGSECTVRPGTEVPAESWSVPAGQRLPIEYNGQRIGVLLVGRALAESEQVMIAAQLTHYGVAVVNLALNSESRSATENYCASLQALEEGIVLFQEEDPETVQARLLSLASSMLHATASALYVLRRVGDADSGLVLVASLGIPEAMLETFRGVDGAAWPDNLLNQPAAISERSADGSLAGLDPAAVPEILRNVVAMPLRYHGVEAGLCVLFNAAIDSDNLRQKLGGVQSLGQLGAALLHRLQLEALAVESRAIARELQIAEAIQKRLMPTAAPVTEEYEFAWSSIAARHIGGDYLDVMASDLGDIHGVVADVSGHGINSALLMSSFRSTYRGDAPWMEPADLAASLNNEVVNEVGATGMFITAVLLRLESGSGQMSLTSAGHNPVMIYRRDSGVVENVDSHGPPLGFLEGATFEQAALLLHPGDVVLLYTDGVTEATDPSLEMFGDDRLAALLVRHADAPVADIVGAVKCALTEFTGSDQYDDDVSVLVIKALGTGR